MEVEVTRIPTSEVLVEIESDKKEKKLNHSACPVVFHRFSILSIRLLMSIISLHPWNNVSQPSAYLTRIEFQKVNAYEMPTKGWAALR